MKKILFTAFAVIATLMSEAQTELTFKPFKFDIALGYAIPRGSGTKGGVLFAIEPKYALNDNITLGLRAEIAITANVDNINSDEATGNVKGSASYLATGDYYFNTNAVRPFVGGGVGVFHNAAANLDATTEADVEQKYKFGFMPRIGIETGHFRAAIEYNAAGKSGTMNNNYLGIKIGFFLGGGRLSD
jgi:outer membrane protein X